jgi:hypothetical protein
MRYRLPLYAKEKLKHSLHVSENERQQSINDVWFGILHNLIGEWSQTSIYWELEACLGRVQAMFPRQPPGQPQFGPFSKLQPSDTESFSQ